MPIRIHSVIVDCTKFKSLDSGETTYYGGEITLTPNIGPVTVINCEGKNDRIDDLPLCDVLERIAKIFAVPEDEVELFDIFPALDVEGHIFTIIGHAFDLPDDDDSYPDAVDKWFKSLKIEDKGPEETCVACGKGSNTVIHCPKCGDHVCQDCLDNDLHTCEG